MEQIKTPELNRESEAIPKKYSNLFSDALLLILLTAGAYWIAYKFESGYLGFYGLSLDLLEIKVENILIAAGSIITFLFLPFMIFNFATSFLPSQPLLREKFIRDIGLIALIVLIFSAYGFQGTNWLYCLGIILFIILLEVVWPIAVFSKKGPIKERFIADEEAENKTRAGLLVNRVGRMLPPVFFITLLLVLLLGSFASIVGLSLAKNQEKYYLIDDSVNTVVVRVYQDRAICITYNPDSNKIQSQVVIENLNSSEKLILSRKKIGKLIPE
ncbi:MAG: hypothetical protein PHU86_02180 [Patescibacteria group bacterium]|nr:hypothetical protein [Patescibacteria group bacterium]